MEKKTQANHIPPMLLMATVLCFVGYFFGYAFGKDLAEQHNARDARIAAQIEASDI